MIKNNNKHIYIVLDLRVIQKIEKMKISMILISHVDIELYKYKHLK